MELALRILRRQLTALEMEIDGLERLAREETLRHEKLMGDFHTAIDNANKSRRELRDALDAAADV